MRRERALPVGALVAVVLVGVVLLLAVTAVVLCVGTPSVVHSNPTRKESSQVHWLTVQVF